MLWGGGGGKTIVPGALFYEWMTSFKMERVLKSYHHASANHLVNLMFVFNPPRDSIRLALLEVAAPA